ncbi:proline dehydrogenase family protein [Pedobacter heparinus]|uniref:proline dehydrogenase family protein n=1 Tax=Pedobacter heparinus TaxID=984 RepID=UPI00292D0CB6|nr:proline dehydrogenase family protein [Pedobacter heparinus]
MDFENTAIGFGYKTDKELKKAGQLFSIMRFSWLVKPGISLTLFALKWKLPVKNLIRNTLFKQFVGGENLPATDGTLQLLLLHKVNAILDYGAEGKDHEDSFRMACKEFLNLISHAATKQNIPFISIKVTGLGRFELLEKINSKVYRTESGIQMNLGTLTTAERQEWHELVKRIELICRSAASHHIGILIDAEESWIQNTINGLTEKMMRKYNTDKAIVYNTIQFYTKYGYPFLVDSINDAHKAGYVLGVKIVRGAYMEKERERAARLNYPCPIQLNKNATDTDFNRGLRYCFENISTVALIIASHNEQSNLQALQLLEEFGLERGHPHIHFSQLYGMSDNITFNLAKSGYSVSKYLPYGPISEVVPYLMRRAQENTSVAGQTSRELLLISRELKRRKDF